MRSAVAGLVALAKPLPLRSRSAVRSTSWCRCQPDASFEPPRMGRPPRADSPAPSQLSVDSFLAQR